MEKSTTIFQILFYALKAALSTYLFVILLFFRLPRRRKVFCVVVVCVDGSIVLMIFSRCHTCSDYVQNHINYVIKHNSESLKISCALNWR